MKPILALAGVPRLADKRPGPRSARLPTHLPFPVLLSRSVKLVELTTEDPDTEEGVSAVTCRPDRGRKRNGWKMA